MRRPLTTPRLFAALALLLAHAGLARAQNVIYVKSLAPGETRPVANGQSWATAYVNLQDALDFRANQSIFNQTFEIWVCGKHIPPTSTRTQPGVIRTETFRKLRQNTRILGGFAGTEAVANQRNPAQNPTILSGDIGNDNNPANNTFTLVTLGGIDGTVQGKADLTLVFDGLIFQDGVANTTGRYEAPCVNIFSDHAATFNNCTFRNNTAGSPNATNGQGAAVQHQSSAKPVFNDCTFIDNFSNGEGGAVWVSGALTGVEFNRCNFIRNKARVGGAVLAKGSPVTINGGQFLDNSAAFYGGAIARLQGGNVVVTNTEFSRNAAGVANPGVLVAASDFAEGGAISLQSTDLLQANDRLVLCRFNDNEVNAQGAPWGANANRGGGAIHHVNGSLVISRCDFNEHALPNSPNALGAAIRAYSGASNNFTQGSRIRIDRSTFYLNESPGGRGGAINTYRGQLDVYASQFIQNKARGDGTAIFYEDPPPTNPANPNGSRASVLIADSLFHANTCTRAGSNCAAPSNGALAAQGDSRVINCTFVNNTASQTAGVMLLQINGSVVPNPTIANSILYANTNLIPLPSGRPYAANFNTDAANISGFLSVVSNCIGGGFPLGNNLSVDPRFLDADGPDNFLGSKDDNYRPALNSPCLDAADSTRLPADAADLDADSNTSESLPLDLDQMPRRQDVPDAPDIGPGGSPVPDIGCYEAIPAVSVSFWNNPAGGAFGTASNWTPSGTPPTTGTAIFDLNASYTVDFPAATTTIDSLEVRTDSVTFDLNTGSVAAAGFTSTLARRTDDRAGLTVRNGAVSVGTLRLADAARTTASLTIEPGTGAGASLTCASALVVGALGNASLTISPNCAVSALITTVGEQPNSTANTIGLLGPDASLSSSLLTQVQRGSIALRNGATLNPGLLGALLLQDGSITGDGTVTGAVFNFGTIAPGLSGPLTGVLALTAGYQQVGTLNNTADSGVLAIDLTPTSNDRLDITGPALLAGGLFVAAQGGFDPAPGYSAPVLTADSIGQPVPNAPPGTPPTRATFDVALFPALSNGRYFVVQYTQAPGSSRREVRVAVQALTQDVITGDTTDVTAPGQPTDLALGRFDHDDFPDLVLALPDTDPAAPGSVTVLRNNGTGSDGAWNGFTFDAQSIFPSGGAQPVDLAVADFNNDGLDDVIVVNKASNNYRVFLNTTPLRGPVTLTPFATPNTDARPSGVVATDFNSDARPDAVISVQGASNVGQVVPLLNLGTSGPAFLGLQSLPGLTVGPGPTAIAAARIAGSSFGDRPGLIVANSGTPEGSGNTVSILYNAGPASPAPFNSAVTVPVGSGPRRIVLDIESDKDTDSFFAAVVNDPNPGVAPQGQQAGGGSISMLRFLPGQTTSPSVTFPAGDGLVPRGAAALDLDFDDDTDLAVVVAGAEANSPASVRVYRNDTPPGDGPLVFAPRAQDLAADQAFTLLASADVNNDGDDDLVILNTDALSGRGARETPNVTIVPVLCQGDFNDDGLVSSPDLVFFLGRFGESAPPGSPASRADFNNNQVVDTPDLVAFIGRFGAQCR